MTKRLVERIRREGPIPFDEFVEHALYGEPDGFYTRGGGAGRAGRDFVTSPEVGTLFGTIVARALDRWWHELGEPDPYLVVEAGAGRGRLAADVLRAGPACAPALRYVLVERSVVLRDVQHELVALEPPNRVLGPAVRPAPEDDPVAVPGAGPLATALDGLPGFPFAGVVLANELLDNLPFRVAEWLAGGWHEVRVGADDDAIVEIVVPAPPDLADAAGRVVAGHGAPEGARVPVPTGLTSWIERCAEVLTHGRLAVVDYAAPAEELLERGQGGWLRTFHAQDSGGPPLDDPGTQDITYDVPVEYLLGEAERVGLRLALHTTQRDWLAGLGVDDLVAQSRRDWDAGRARGDLDAIAARSRVHEAEALTDPAGLGDHHVFVFESGGPGRSAR